MCGWSQAPFPGPPPIPGSSPSPVPDPNILFLLSINLYLRFTPSAWSQSLEMTATAGGLRNAASHLPVSPPAGRLDARHPIACDSPRAADLQKEVSSCWKQAVTAVLTNYMRTSAGECGYLYQLKPPQQPGDKTETQHGSGGGRGGEERNKGADVKKEARRATVWQHNQWASAELSCKRNTSFYFLSRPPPVMLLHSYVEASSHTVREGAVREQRRGG